MPKSSYLPKTDAGKAAFLNNLGTQLVTYGPTVGLSPSDIAAVQDDAGFFSFAFNAQPQILAFAQQWTSYKNAARDGGPGTSMGPPPVAPTFAPPATIVAPGIIARATAIVARIKAAPGYTDAIGQALMIVGADQVVDPNAMKPVITAASDAGQVIIGWTKSGMDSLEIWVDRGTGFAFLAIDTVPDYTDTQAMPAAGQSALWKYKAIYRLGDERVGQWSDVVSLPVAG
jgi:hypothetical protein